MSDDDDYEPANLMYAIATCLLVDGSIQCYTHRGYKTKRVTL